MGIFAMIMWTITTEKIGSKILKTLIIIVILLYGSIIIVNFKTETPDNLYTEIKEWKKRHKEKIEGKRKV